MCECGGVCVCVCVCIYVWVVYSAYACEGPCAAHCFYQIFVINVSYVATLLSGKMSLSISVCVGDYNWETKHHHCIYIYIYMLDIC